MWLWPAGQYQFCGKYLKKAKDLDESHQLKVRDEKEFTDSYRIKELVISTYPTKF